MILSMKRKRMMKERREAVPQRERAARDFATAVREVEAALDALKAANDRLYRSDVQHEQAALNELRRSRERMFAFVAAKEVVAEAPYFARLMGLKVAPTQCMPMTEWVRHVGQLDINAIADPGNATTIENVA